MGKTNFTFVQRLFVVVTMMALGFTQSFAQADLCADATDLAGNGPAPFTVSGSTDAATFDADAAAVGLCDPGNIFNNDVEAPGVWYTFTAASNHLASFSTCDQANFDTKLSLYEGGCGALACVGGGVSGNDDGPGCTGFTSFLEVNVVAGETYHLLVHGFGTSTGDFDLTVDADIAAPPVGGNECEPPVNGDEDDVTGTSATFTWNSVNTPVNDHCWNFYIGNEGFDCDENEEFIAATVCNVEVDGNPNYTSNNPLVTLVSVNNATGAVEIAVTGLQPGTVYEWSLFETCDGAPANNTFDCDDATFGPFQTFDDPYTVTWDDTVPTCPDFSPGFVPDGSFTVTIDDSPTCPGSVYDITVVAGPYLTDPTGYAGVGEGTYLFEDAGPGVYTVTITETSVCNPVNDPEVVLVTVGQGVDTEAPIFYVTDILGNIISDNDPATPEGGVANLIINSQAFGGLLQLGGIDNAVELDDYFLPEGSCNYQAQWYVTGEDNCDGQITAADAIITNVWIFSVAGNPLPGFDAIPNAQVDVVPDGTGIYLIDINWPAGFIGISIQMQDAAGNGGQEAVPVTEGLWFIRELIEFNDPEVVIVGANNVTIPHCADSRTITVTAYFADLCEQEIDPAGIFWAFNGTETVTFFDLLDDDFGGFGFGFPFDYGGGYIEWEVEVSLADDGDVWAVGYTDEWGNTGFADVAINVAQAAADEPAVIIAADDNVTVPYCEDDVFFCYSFQIYDDCAPVNPALVTFDNDGSGLNETVGGAGWYVDVNGQTNTAFFEVCGDVAPDTYVFDISYNGEALVQPLVNINGQQNQAPVVVLPGNLNVNIPVCEDDVTTTWSITISDDCDDFLQLQNLQVFFDETFNGTGLPTDLAVNWINPPAGYFEFTGTFTPDDDGVLLVVIYTDSDGLTTIVDAEINVTYQPDVFDPIVVYPSQDFDIELDPCDDPVVTDLDFYVTAADNCGIQSLSVTLYAFGNVAIPLSDGNGDNKYELNDVLPGGAPVGQHYVEIIATDVNGNSTTESFEIDITQDPAEEDNLACIADLNITLDDYCEAVLSPEIVLTGEWGCLTPDDFAVTVIDSDPSNGDLIDGCGTFGYSIEYVGEGDANFTICWGEVTAEDKTSPVVTCPGDVYGPVGTVAEFICTDIDRILIDGVEYYTTYANGNTVPGSMSSTLSYILGQTGRPYVWDNCGKVRVAVWDTVEESECGYDVITRHFEVADRYESDCTGAPMTDYCTQRIYVRKANFGDLNVPDDIVELSCASYDEVPGPEVTGFPTVSTVYGTYNLDDSYCNLGATYEDTPAIDICPNSFKVIRTWSIIDWCVEPATVVNYTQIIKVGDFEGPSISCNLVDTDWDGVGDSHPTYSTGPFDCTAAFPIPTPVITDDCNDYEWYVDVVISVEEPVYNQWGQQIGTQIGKQTLASYGPMSSSQSGPYVSGVPMSLEGDEGLVAHYFEYTAVDACGNTSATSCPFYVVDDIAPVAVCDDDLHISVGGEGYARVYAEDVDEGSNDNCELVHIEVRRAGGVWGPWVDFDCDDVHNFVTIELRVWDASGNSNICWLEVLVEDKINPYCHAPHNTSLHCDDHELLHIDWDDAAQLNEVFGAAMGEDNCNATAEQISVNNNLNECGWGTVVRTFQATDDWGLTSQNVCQQVISIYEVHNYEIKFPKDADAECGTPNPDTIAYVDHGCDLITVNVNDEIYEATSDECYKVLRTYKVINWCEWDGESAPIVIGRDEDCDNNPGDEDVYVIVRTIWNGDDPIFTTYVDRDNDETNTNPFIGTNRCGSGPYPNGHWANSNINTELTSVGHWQYTQVIKVYDFVAPTAVVTDYGAFCSETADCFGDVTIEFTVTELCDLDVVTAEGFLDAFADGVLDGPATVTETGRDEAAGTITYEISGNYPLGAHMFGVHIEDGCENVLWLEIPFEVVDCKAPTPICINGLTVTLMPQPDGCCAMAIWASDFIASDVDDCTEPVKYSIHLQDEVEDGTEIPSPDVTGLVLDCTNEETEMIRIYSWDSAYNPYAVQPDGTIGGPNYDYCETYVLVQAWVTCDDGPAGAIAGAIATEENEGLEGAEVQLSADVFLDALTATDGSYEFTDVTLGTDVTITPHLDANPLNGVSTFDLVLISKHILGVQLLDSPYKMISADVNSSSTITTADMIQLRKLILGVYTDFPNNTSWRFVDADYVFPDPSNPWAEEFPEVINIVNLDGDYMNEDFISAKIGDVNGSATPNVTSVEERNINGLFTINTDDVRVKAGNQYSVSFTAADLAKIQGYQFSLTFDNAALSLTDIEYGVATEENFGLTYLGEGIITTSWNGEAADNSVLFTLVFTANTEAQLSDLIGVSSRITVAEAYDNNGTLDVAINFNGEVATAGFEVYQNTPNPFRGETIIGYNLPEDADVQITIQDVTGKTLQVINQTSAKGYNAYTLSAENLGTGVLYYTVSTDEFTATKKMILVK